MNRIKNFCIGVFATVAFIFVCIKMVFDYFANIGKK